jgi:hypothetical protein
VAVVLVHQVQAPQLEALAQQGRVYAVDLVVVVVDPVSHLVLQQVLAVLEVFVAVEVAVVVLLLTQAPAELVVLVASDMP